MLQCTGYCPLQIYTSGLPKMPVVPRLRNPHPGPQPSKTIVTLFFCEFLSNNIFLIKYNISYRKLLSVPYKTTCIQSSSKTYTQTNQKLWEWPVHGLILHCWGGLFGCLDCSFIKGTRVYLAPGFFHSFEEERIHCLRYFRTFTSLAVSDD